MNCQTTVLIDEYEWLAEGHISQYIPARTSGPPEHWYPEEGGELEDVKLTLIAVDNKEPLYYHRCHAPCPDNNLVETALFEAYDEAYDDF